MVEQHGVAHRTELIEERLRVGELGRVEPPVVVGGGPGPVDPDDGARDVIGDGAAGVVEHLGAVAVLVAPPLRPERPEGHLLGVSCEVEVALQQPQRPLVARRFGPEVETEAGAVVGDAGDRGAHHAEVHRAGLALVCKEPQAGGGLEEGDGCVHLIRCRL